MAILPGGQRRYLFEKGLVYLFSYDASVVEEGWISVPGGMKFCMSAAAPAARPEPPRGLRAPRPRAESSFDARLVYHVLDEERVAGNDAITGTVRWSQYTGFLPHETAVGDLTGAIVIETTDRAVIDSQYRGSLALGALGLRHFDVGSDWAAESEGPRVTRIKAFIAPRFETAHPKYKWLTQRQCAGFGSFDIENGRAIRATFDIYALG